MEIDASGDVACYYYLDYCAVPSCQMGSGRRAMDCRMAVTSFHLRRTLENFRTLPART